jgi:hypothetical protein
MAEEQDQKQNIGSKYLDLMLSALGGAGAAKSLAGSKAALAMLLRSKTKGTPHGGGDVYDLVDPETYRNVGKGTFHYDPEQRHITANWIGTHLPSPFSARSIPFRLNARSQALGYSNVRDLLDALKLNFPGARSLSGVRVSGASTAETPEVPKFLDIPNRFTRELPPQPGILAHPPPGFESALNDPNYPVKDVLDRLSPEQLPTHSY